MFLYLIWILCAKNTVKATESTASLEAGLQGFGLLWRPKPALLGPVGTVTGIIAGPLSIRSVPALWWVPVESSDFIGTKDSVSTIQPAVLSAPHCSEHNQYTSEYDHYGLFRLLLGEGALPPTRRSTPDG